MNSETILQEINNLSDSVNKLVSIFHRKLKSPSLYSREDLRGEAIETIIRVLRSEKYFDPKKKVKLSTYLLQCIKNRFYDLLWESYKTNHLVKEEKKNFRIVPLERFEIFEVFSKSEMEYINALLFPSKEVREEFLSSKGNQVRKIVRRHLGISLEIEGYLRTQIKRKLLELMEKQ